MLMNTKLWHSKFIELDVCGRPLFAHIIFHLFLLYIVAGTNDQLQLIFVNGIAKLLQTLTKCECIFCDY